MELKTIDWPGSRFGTFALCLATLGVWPTTLEGLLQGDVYLSSLATTNQTAGIAPLMWGYKCNLSVFSPIGLIASVNGFPGYNGQEAHGLMPAPDPMVTKPVYLSEIARGIAEAMAPDTRAYLAAAADNPAGKTLSPPTSKYDRALSSAHLLVAKPRATDIRSFPPRYEEPDLPDNRLTLVTTTDETWIVYVDGALVCPEADYSLKGLKKSTFSHSAKILPGEHKLTFAYYAGAQPVLMSTNLTVSAAQRYQAERIIIGYSAQLSIKLISSSSVSVVK